MKLANSVMPTRYIADQPCRKRDVDVPGTSRVLFEACRRTQLVGRPVRAALHPTGLYLALRRSARTSYGTPSCRRRSHECRHRRRSFTSPETTSESGFGHRSGRTHLPRRALRLDVDLAIAQELDDLVVYAEPQPVNEILLPPHRWPRPNSRPPAHARRAFARHARRPCVLKFSSWNTLYRDILAEAFPKTPWVLSLRDPIEVGVSLLRGRPGWLQRRRRELPVRLAVIIAPCGCSVSR